MDKKLTVRSTLQGGLPLYNEEPKDLRSTTCRGQHNGGTEFQTEVYYILIVSPATLQNYFIIWSVFSIVSLALPRNKIIGYANTIIFFFVVV